MKIQTKITKMLNIDLPIIGAPMFLISYPELVAAVSEAGGLGTFPAQNYRTVEELKDGIAEIRDRTKKPFGVNIILHKEHNPHWPAQMEILLQAHVPVIIASLGIPRTLIKEIKQAGSKVFCDVVHLRQAKLLAKLGVDAIVAVCAGAGGHAGNITPFTLIPQIAEHVDVPVIAAGAISGGRQMAAAFNLGAEAVYIGTRFIASAESSAPAKYKQMVLDAGPEDIIYSDKISGIYANWLKPSLEAAGIDPSKPFDYKSHMDEYSRWKDIWSAGQGVGQFNGILPVKEIIKEYIDTYQKTIRI